MQTTKITYQAQRYYLCGQIGSQDWRWVDFGTPQETGVDAHRLVINELKSQHENPSKFCSGARMVRRVTTTTEEVMS